MQIWLEYDFIEFPLICAIIQSKEKVSRVADFHIKIMLVFTNILNLAVVGQSVTTQQFLAWNKHSDIFGRKTGSTTIT